MVSVYKSQMVKVERSINSNIVNIKGAVKLTIKMIRKFFLRLKRVNCEKK